MSYKVEDATLSSDNIRETAVKAAKKEARRARDLGGGADARRSLAR